MSLSWTLIFISLSVFIHCADQLLPRLCTVPDHILVFCSAPWEFAGVSGLSYLGQGLGRMLIRCVFFVPSISYVQMWEFPDRNLSKCLCFPCEENWGMAEENLLTSQTGGYGSFSCSERKEGTVTGSQVCGCKDGGGRWASQKPRNLELLCRINANIRKLWLEHPVRWTGSHHLRRSSGYAPVYFFFLIWKSFPALFGCIQMPHWSSHVVSLSLLS